jgi:radical SAM superfamily enzyme YgiQ (UPF0313 family)
MPSSRSTRIKLVYPPQQFDVTENPRPDGSLGLLYLAAKLRDDGFPVSLLDACVGDDEDDLSESFYNRTRIDETHVRVGLSPERLKQKLAGHRIVGVTSIFTPQTYNCFEVARLAKEVDPEILTVAGGGNAREFHELFLNNGFDIVVFGEGEETMLEIARAVEEGNSWKGIRSVAYKDGNGDIVVNPERPVLQELDRLPIPAWDLLPLKKYWALSKPHSGTFEPGTEVRYLSMQTSRGCPYRCKYCHISKEGDAARLRLKSHERVMREIDRIKSLGAEYLFFEDDSLLAKLPRIKRIFRELKTSGLKIIDVNGVNLAHFFKRDPRTRKLVVDEELLDLMVDVGWVEIGFPYESGSQRILDDYATGKWRRDQHDVIELTRLATQRGLRVSGFFTIGYPDESYDELTETYLLARDLVVKGGLGIAEFYVIQPYPGSVLYDMAVENKHLPDELDLLNMKFGFPTMVGTKVPIEVLRYTRRLAYQLINDRQKIARRQARNKESPLEPDQEPVDSELRQAGGEASAGL